AFGGGELALFMNGVNLEQFPAYVQQFPLLVTFNGSQFDVPFLRSHFPQARLDQAHIDLRFVLGSLGYRGGLKAVESRLGLKRDPQIEGTDGFEAVRLWYQYRRGSQEAIKKLVLYNLTDVVNMVQLMEIAFGLKIRALTFPGSLPRPESLTVPELGQSVTEAWTRRLLENTIARGQADPVVGK
ncbi:MAG TPA: ribonuclease H-like domain-containing protein, partial [Phycisphaerae bacterium]|nr:ribonuclease H-like domain-containing protein [Phycisphaerae bacterium]